MAKLSGALRTLPCIAACSVLAWSAPQTNNPVPAFEVASLTVNTSATLNSSIQPAPGEFRIVNHPLKSCITMAFGLQDFEMVGPEWLASIRIDVRGKPAAGDSPRLYYQMLQSLLIERFAMKIHWESKELAGFRLQIAKGGPKMRPLGPDEPRMGGSAGNRSVKGRGQPVSRLVQQLSYVLARPVQDMTDLKGDFNYQLEFAPDVAPADSSSAAGEGGPNTLGPSLYTVLQEQLGLRLEAAKIPVKVLVIDHVERAPVAN